MIKRTVGRFLLVELPLETKFRLAKFYKEISRETFKSKNISENENSQSKIPYNGEHVNLKSDFSCSSEDATSDSCNCNDCCTAREMFHRLVVQSSDIIRDQTDEVTKEQVNVEFEDTKDRTTVLSSNVSNLYQPTMSKNSDLNEFLSRPVRIWNIDASTGSSFSFNRNPWYEYFNHASIKRKIDNYAYIRCDLHIKVVINASPFYYGAYLLSYKPLHGEFNSAPINTGAGDKVWLFPTSSCVCLSTK